MNAEYPEYKNKLRDELKEYEENKKSLDGEIKSIKMQLDREKTDDDRVALMSELSLN